MLTGFNIGGDDYIAKPFSIKELSARVKAVLRRSDREQQEKPRVIQIGAIHIDLSTKQISVNERLVPLTKKEFEILKLFAQTPGRIFSREEILDRVWDDDGFVLERTVDVHITRLRKKLGDQGHCIVNRSGYGYCIEI